MNEPRYWKGEEQTDNGIRQAMILWCPNCGRENSLSPEAFAGERGIACTCGFREPIKVSAVGVPCGRDGKPIGPPMVTKAPEPAKAEPEKLEAKSSGATGSPPEKPKGTVWPAQKAR